MDPQTTASPGGPGAPNGSASPESLLATAHNLAAKHRAGGGSTEEQRAKWREKARRQRDKKMGLGGGPSPVVPTEPDGFAGGAPVADPVLDPALLRSCLEAGLSTLNELAVSHVTRRTFRVTEDKALALEIGTGVDISKPRLNLLCDTGVVILQKYQLVGQYFPEIAFSLGLASWGLQFARVMKRLDEMEAQRLLSEKAERAAKEPPKQTA